MTDTAQQRLDRLANQRDGFAVMVARECRRGEHPAPSMPMFDHADAELARVQGEVCDASRVRGVA